MREGAWAMNMGNVLWGVGEGVGVPDMKRHATCQLKSTGCVTFLSDEWDATSCAWFALSFGVKRDCTWGSAGGAYGGSLRVSGNCEGEGC